ncbi:hypothetical protein AB6A23_05975 [Paenibacillus tarimensis]
MPDRAEAGRVIEIIGTANNSEGPELVPDERAGLCRNGTTAAIVSTSRTRRGLIGESSGQRVRYLYENRSSEELKGQTFRYFIVYWLSSTPCGEITERGSAKPA